MKLRFGAVAGLGLLLGACGTGDWLKRIGWREAERPLERVMVGADATPGNQGLLYVAMAEAEVAGQAATRAIASADDPLGVRGQIGEVIYALAPEKAPNWEAKSRGIVPGWVGKGYGVLPAVDGIQAELTRFAAVSPGPDERLDAARVCIANTRAWADQALKIALGLIDGASPGQLQALLPQLERYAQAIYQGLDADADGEIAIAEGECGLQQAERFLDEIRLQQAAS